MPAPENLGSFIRENKSLASDYVETRIEILRLKMIRSLSKLAGQFIWVIISLFLFSLLAIFLGLVTGFWLSEITGSFTKGFGLTALILLVLILLIAALRKYLFINPIIRIIIRKTSEDRELEENNHPFNPGT
jgi:hypothetical protein